MIDQLAGQTRKLLVMCRCLAMRGEGIAALARLDDAMASADPAMREPDRIALKLLKAEILYLDCRDQESLALIELIIRNAPPETSYELMFVLRNNRSEIGLNLFQNESLCDFYRLADEQKLVGFQFFNALDVVSGEEAVAAGRHYDALPLFWRELVRTYQIGCWRPFRWAAKRLAQECLALGELADASYYAILAREDKVAEAVGIRLLAQRDSQAIRNTIDKCLTTANLLRHFDMACEILLQIGDAIPDEQLDTVAIWLQSRCSLIPDSQHKIQILSKAWETIVPIAERLNPSRAEELVRIALTHPYWTETSSEPNRVFPSREEMVTAVTHLARRLPVEFLGYLVEQSVPLATTRRQLHDYPEVINLLCNLAERADDEVKKKLRTVLFPSGRPVDPYLAQAAFILQHQPPPTEQLAESAVRIAQHIRLQLQRLTPDQEPAQVPGQIFAHTQTLGSLKIVTSMVQGVELHAISRYRQLLKIDSLTQIVDAVLELVGERENFLANRTILIRGLMEFADCFDSLAADRIFAALAPIARGEIQEPTTVMTSAEIENPLNPMKMRTGNPSNLRGAALLALAHIARNQDKAYQRQLRPLLEAALTDTVADVRRYAYAATRELPSFSGSIFVALLLGTRDSDEYAAASAFAALIVNEGYRLTANQWQLLLYSAKLALQSPSVRLRRTAAAAVARLMARTLPSDSLRLKAEELLHTFSADICASVRRATTAQSDVD